MKKIIYFLFILITTFFGIYIGKIKLASIYHNKGVELFNNGNYEEAGEYFKKAIKIYPGSYQSHYELGNSYSFSNRHKEAIQEYQEALKIKNTDPRLYSNIAQEYLALEDYQNASKIVQEAILLFPEDKNLIKLKRMISFEGALFLSKKAEESLDSGRISTAIELYQKALSIYSGLPTVYLNLALLYKMTNEYEKSEELLKKYIMMNPKDAFAYKILGDVYLNENIYVDAVENYKKAVELNSSFTEAYNGMALAYDYLGYYNSALESILNAYKLDSSNEFILYNLGKIYRDNRKYEDSLNTFLKLKELNPEFPFLKESLAEIYILLGDKREATEILREEVVQTEQRYREKRDRLSLLKLIYLHFVKKDYGVIKRLIQEAIKEGRDFPELHYFYGRVWEENENLIQASREYEKAIRSRFGLIAKERYYKIILHQERVLK